jgi:hypothetical protein
MKYSIRGTVSANREIEIMEVINSVVLHKLDIRKSFEVVDYNNHNIREIITFEVWVNDSTNSDFLFDNVSNMLDTRQDFVSFHECYNDEPNGQPCVIMTEKRGGKVGDSN